MAATPEHELVSFALPAVTPAPDDAPAPHFAAIPGSLASLGPPRLDPARARAREPERPAASARRTVLPFALAGSIALHLLPLAVLVDWQTAPVEVAPPIPVQLVVVPPRAPPQPPPPAPRETRRPAPGRLASENMGSPTGERRAAGGGEAPVAVPKPAPPAPKPPPKPAPSADLVSDLPPPKPAAMPLPTPRDDTQVAMLPPPRPPAPARPRRPERPTPQVKRLAGSWPLAPAHLGAPGPAATRDEYLAYCNNLIKRHFDMLPPSFIAGRRGLTQLALVVRDDGRIAHISLVRSSGYDDIDERVEKMVAAVGRFPPLPQWYQGHQVTLLYDLPIPGGLEQR